MKLLCAFFVLFMLVAQPDVAEIRKVYPEAAKTESAAKDFAAKMATVSNDNNKTLWAYKGAALTLLAKFANKISDKISNLKEGSKYIDDAAAAEPTNIEIRLIRLSVQESVPLIVNYRKNKDEDKAFIMAHYKEQNSALKEYVRNFIQGSKSFSDAEKKAYK